MLKIAIVEDEIQEQEKLEKYIVQYFENRNTDIDIKLFNDGDMITDEYSSFDILFMDIEMKRMDGISAAKIIREMDEHVIIIFVTNLVNQALTGYSVDATDFIIKPLIYSSFSNRMDRVMRKLDIHQDKYLQIKTGKETVYVNINDIAYIESSNKKTILHRINQSQLIISNPLYQIETQLLNSGFFRCHSAFLVNLRFVSSLSANSITIKENLIPISKHRKKEFLEALTNFKGRML